MLPLPRSVNGATADDARVDADAAKLDAPASLDAEAQVTTDVHGRASVGLERTLGAAHLNGRHLSATASGDREPAAVDLTEDDAAAKLDRYRAVAVDQLERASVTALGRAGRSRRREQAGERGQHEETTDETPHRRHDQILAPGGVPRVMGL